MLKFFEGKKTYIGAALLALAAVAGFWFGAVDATQFVTMLCMALIAFGLRDAQARAAAEFIATIEQKMKDDAAAKKKPTLPQPEDGAHE